LTASEMEQISGRNRDERTGPDPDTFSWIPRH
jgi:2,5-diketo-D-gluconate reductase A